MSSIIPKLASIILLISSLCVCHAQGQIVDKINVGIGFGLDYGGIGSRVTYQPIKQLGIFGAVGYNFNSVGYNVGAQLRFPSEKRIDWFLSGMYGYNAVIQISGATETKTTYYGPSLGAGVELKVGQSRKSFFSFELILPFRPQVDRKSVV